MFGNLTLFHIGRKILEREEWLDLDMISGLVSALRGLRLRRGEADEESGV